ncbi:MAG: cytochrome P450 [Pseudomonadota bacterium]
MADTKRIPTPPKTPIVGNLLSIDSSKPLQDLMNISREQGPIFKLDMMGKPLIMAWGHDIVDELCDEKRFDKAVRGALYKVRSIAGDGLFTGKTDEPNWSKAHNILLPTFSRQAMANYMPMMLDVGGQLVQKWERLNSDDEIDVVHDMTAIALDVIGICGFNYRFNSFYRRDYHPFIDALNRSLETCMVQRGLPFESTILHSRLSKLEEDTNYMNNLVDEIIKERRAGDGSGPNDLLNYMLQGVDKATGEGLSDENIRYQIITFLIAGHETTSGMMSFALYYLLNNPDVLERAYEEVDRVLGRDIAVEPSLKQVNQLTYVQQILFEALRLWPTAPAFSVYPYQNEILKDGYRIKESNFVTVLTLMLHRDQSVWGERAEEFDPEQFSRENMATRPTNAYKPFGNGQRACIGRQFAMQEATLVLGMILQRFELIDHKNYQLNIKESLSIKPDGFRMRVRLRPDVVRGRLVSAGEDASVEGASLAEAAKRPTHGNAATVLYGSNLGTTEEFARTIAREAELNGFDTTLAPLDDFAGKLPKTGVTLIACASYNGQPPDNAAKFIDWLASAGAGEGEGVRYALLGCGHSDWAATFQATPRLLDDGLERIGATRITDRQEVDAREDIDDQFQGWVGGLWPKVGEALGLDLDAPADAAPLYKVEFLSDEVEDGLIAESGSQPMTIQVNRELQNSDASGRSTRHIEVDLPEGMTYRTGDHLCVVPRNDLDLVRRVEARFGLAPQTQVKLTSASGGHSQLPTGAPVSTRRLLSDYLELQAVATRKDVELLARNTECPHSKPQLEALAGDGYSEGVFAKRVSVLELLERFPACEAPFAVFIEMCPMMALRYYSISSSSAVESGKCSVTVGVVDAPAISGKGQFKGVCSNYLSRAGEGTTIHATMKETKANFRLPDDPSKPIIMVGPGTGIAPFRGFLQERALLKEQGKTLGPAILFFGCRHPDQDFLYEDELKAWVDAGVADLQVAFSRKEKAKTYVQDLIREQRDNVWPLLEAGAHVYVCGDGGRMEPDVRRALARIYSEEKDVGADVADAWVDGLSAEGRYNLDVWVGG